MRKDGSVTEPLQGMTPTQTREIAVMLRQHIAWENAGVDRPSDRIRRIYRLGIRKRLWIIRALGRTLGDAVYSGFHEGRVSLEQIRGLFRERFDDAGSGARLYLEWVRLLRPYRG